MKIKNVLRLSFPLCFTMEKNYAKRIEILRNLLEYLNRARNDAETYSEKEITQSIEEEYMNVLDRIREEGKLESKLETARKMKEKCFSILEIQDKTVTQNEQTRSLSGDEMSYT